MTSVQSLTEYPSILGGRVKTLHPKIFGGILNRVNNEQDDDDLKKLKIAEENGDVIELKEILKAVVVGFTPEKEITDVLTLQKEN